MATSVGLGLFTAQIPPWSERSFVQEYRDIVELSRLAESAGFDSVWVSEHHGATDGYLPSLLPALAAIAAATDRVLLGTGVLLAPFHHPLRLAEDAAVVDQLSGGRLVLGLGLGWREEELRMFGVPVSERVRRTVETLQVLRKAWTAERFTHRGRVFRFEEVRVTPPPAREGGPPLYLGGHVEPAARRAGRFADGYIRSRGGIDGAEHLLAEAEAGARAVGKDPAGLGFAQLQNAFVWDGEDAWERVRPGAAHQLGTYPAWFAGHDTPGRPMEVAELPEEDVRKLTPAGRPQEILRALRPWVDRFGDRSEFHLIVRLHYPGMDSETAGRAVELFGRDVLPALRT